LAVFTQGSEVFRNVVLIAVIALLAIDGLTVAHATDNAPIAQPHPTEAGDSQSQNETIEVRASRLKLDLSSLQYEDRALLAGESLARFLELRPQFWLERTGGSDMQARLYVDGLGPERIAWRLNGHALGDLAVVGWQVSDLPIEWVGTIETRLSGQAPHPHSSFRPFLKVETRKFDDEVGVSSRLGIADPREHQVGLEILSPTLGRWTVADTTRFGGRTIYDDQGTWYDSADDRIVQFESERSGRQSLAFERVWSLNDAGLSLEVMGFSLSDFRQGPASVESASTLVDSARDGAFVGVRLSNEGKPNEWTLGVNGFYGDRQTKRSDALGNSLSIVNDSFKRFSAWYDSIWVFGQHSLGIDGAVTLTGRRDGRWKSFGETLTSGTWRYLWRDGVQTSWRIEGLLTQRPLGDWLVCPTSHLTLLLSDGALSFATSLEYSVRRPTLVEWFGDGRDLLANESLNPEWGIGAGIEVEWTPVRELTFLLDGRLRRGDDWVAWIPSSFSTRKAVNLGEFRQGVVGLTSRWLISSKLESLLSIRASWSREREGQGSWRKLPQDAPLRILATTRWSPWTSLTFDLSGDYVGQRALDRQNLINSKGRVMLHGGVIWAMSESAVLALRGRNLLNRLSALATTPGGETLDIAEMSVLGFPVSGREIMLTLSLKALEDM